MFGCGATFETAAGAEGILQSNFEESKKLLKEAGYDGKPIVVLQTTDINTHVHLAPVAKSQLEKGGFKVDVQSMDWQTQVSRRAKKDPVDKGGWNISMTAAATVLLSDPIVNHYSEATGDRGSAARWAVFPGRRDDAQLNRRRRSCSAARTIRASAAGHFPGPAPGGSPAGRARGPGGPYRPRRGWPRPRRPSAAPAGGSNRRR